MFSKTVQLMIFCYTFYVSAKIPNPNDKILYKCDLDDEEFWFAYAWNFKNSTEINIVQITTNNSEIIIDEYITKMLISYVRIQTQTNMTFFIKRYKLQYFASSVVFNNSDFTCVKHNVSEEIDVKSVANVSSKDNAMQDRARSFSADFNYAFHVVVWNVEDFEHFILYNFKILFTKPRGIYMVAFLSPALVNSFTLKALFERIWKNYGVLNIVFQLPCSCARKYLYMYNPFEKVGDNWGEVKKFTVKDLKVDGFQYRNTLINLNGYPIKVGLFERLPTVIKPPDGLKDNQLYKNLTLSCGYAGLDGMLMGCLAEVMNFVPHISSTEKDYGFVNNGTFGGSFADVINHKVDVSFNSRFVDGFGGDLVEYLFPVINDKYCLVVPKASRVPQWLSLFYCFDKSIWFLIFVSYVISSLYWYNVQSFKLFSTKYATRNGVESFLDIFSLFISVPVHIPSLNNNRLFLLSCMVFNIIIVGAFQGQLVTSFSTHNYYQDINTLEQFEKSQIKILSSLRNIGYLFGTEDSKLANELRKRIVTTNRSGLIKQIAKGEKISTFERLADANLRIKLYGAEEKVHICQECPQSYYFTYIVPKYSPYTHVLDIFITLFTEVGLVAKWSNDVINFLIIQQRANMLRNFPQPSKTFSLSNLQIPFYILITGWITSCIIFCFELHRSKKK